MKHEAFRDLISLDCDGRLSPSDRVRLDAHLSECKECRLFAEGVQATSLFLKNAELPQRSEAFVQSIMSRLPETVVEADVPFRWLAPVLATALTVVVLVWSPTVSTALAGPDSLVSASLEEPTLELWETAR